MAAVDLWNVLVQVYDNFALQYEIFLLKLSAYGTIVPYKFQVR